MEQIANKIAILYDASQAVLATFELDEVLQHILTIARDYFHLSNVAILLKDREKQDLYPRAMAGWDPGFTLFAKLTSLFVRFPRVTAAVAI